IGHLVDAALAGQTPALDPVAQVEAAVWAEIAIRGEDRPDEIVTVGQLEGGALGLEGEGVDAAAAAGAAKIAQEEVALVLLRQQADAWVMRESARPVGDVRQRRHEIGRLCVVLRVPEFLAIPGAEAFQILVADAPAAVAALDDVDPAGLVAAVGVV